MVLERALRLQRQTEYCQWQEFTTKECSKCTREVNGKQEEYDCNCKITFHYTKAWRSHRISSLLFDQAWRYVQIHTRTRTCISWGWSGIALWTHTYTYTHIYTHTHTYIYIYAVSYLHPQINKWYMSDFLFAFCTYTRIRTPTYTPTQYHIFIHG